VVARWRRTEALGHPAIFQVKERQLREQVAALLCAEVDSPPAEGCRPSEFEREFGPLEAGGVWLKGKIDRIDMGVGRAVVLDYKNGRKASYQAQVTDEALCDSAWQLPIYAEAARVELGVGEVEARFYSLREAAPTRAVRAPADFADKLAALHATMRGGDFAVKPREDACDRCNMEHACRVRQLRTNEDDP
jgi:hypothetical protein